MQLAPSQIHFVRDYSTECFKPDENLVNSISHRTLKLTALPKIQVVERHGAWFALNNSYLHVFRELEKQGMCPRIHVDVVPLSRVPKHVQETMVVQQHTVDDNGPKRDDDDNSLRVLSRPSGRLDLESNDLGKTSFFGQKIGEIKEVQRDDKEPQKGPGRVTKRGYHKLSDGGGDDCPLHDSETEATSSFSGTECSDYGPEGDGVGEVESDSESEDALTCNVCDRSFVSTRKLAQHQQRKRHFGCSVCDSIFPTLMTLELHKESLEHWSDDEGVAQGGRGSDSESDSDDDDVRSPTEELERLL